RVFDRLRFRLIVRDADDLVPTLRIMLHRCIPFNYVVPDQTVNSLIDLESLTVLGRPSFDTAAAPQPGSQTNEFSAKGFHVLNFVADLPVRVDSLLPAGLPEGERRGRVVFVLAEFQVMDKRTAEANEQGEQSHAEYKRRQH